DQCSWVHMHEPEKATAKAKDLVRMVVAKAYLLEPLKRLPLEVTKSALVVGGGLSGMTAALEIADQGYPVHLVERTHELGGNLHNLKFVLNPIAQPSEKAEIDFIDTHKKLNEIIKKLKNSKNIHVHTNTEINNIAGFVGNFTTTLKVNGKEQEIQQGAIVIATGAKKYKPQEFLYGKDKRVVTQLELEEMLMKGERQKAKGDIGNGSHPELSPLASRLSSINNIVMIQCVGSRTEERTYCSRVCCTEAIKNALKLKKLNPNADVYILYRDMRTYGFREDYYTEAAQAGVRFIRFYEDSQPEVKINDSSGVLEVFVKDHMLDENLLIKPELLVLSAATVPEPDNERLSQLLKVPLTKDKFFLEAHMKLRPVDFATDGIFLCGLAHSPKFIEECVSQANGVVARASTILSKPTIEGEAIISVVDESKCRGCGECVETCEYGAPELQLREDGTKVSHINEALCKGCGACAVACCNGAITTKHFRNDQIMTMVEAALDFKRESEVAIKD
ncbi:MAG: CoB--CoM heterodisulfide reductase iron-sulfur subunit A family protein, partial [Thermoplasmata archaeon]|nr:CoB--CoM heterodisulfide reductase iron-sulfur subunit A family protein [Thermoplasmata archaeon]